MDTSKYTDPNDRKAAKRITRHPLYQRLRERAVAVERELIEERRRNKTLSETVMGHLKTIERLKKQIEDESAAA